ncbi:ATP-binding protein [Labrys okinawensis]|uniref:ATP-binding protein n=1 Tax=Labrys okinawensis TaxID=346911 RepID=UPI0039BC286B
MQLTIRDGVYSDCQMCSLDKFMLYIVVFLAARIFLARGVAVGAILVRAQSDVRSPFYAENFSAMRKTVNWDATEPITLHVENLDLRRFNRPAYEDRPQNHLRAKCSVGPLKGRGDEIQLEQVLRNLVMNSLDAMRQKTNGRREIAGLAARLNQVSAEISIVDNRPGVDPAKLNNVLKPYYTRMSEGMAMGLSIARKIVAAHSGQIWVEIRPRGGAEFQARLPLLQ